MSDQPLPSRRIFALCFLAGLCEGYDMLAAGIAAPKFAPVFGLTPGQLGLVFSAATFGLFVGALAGGRLADRIGRRAVIIGSLVLLGVFSIGSALVTQFDALLAMRFLTGLGLGGVLPNILALTNESSRRPEQGAMRVTMLGSSMPFGGAVLGILSAASPDLDWRTIFWIGGVAPLVVAVVMAVLLPASTAQPAAAGPQGGLREALTGEGRIGASVLIWISSFFIALSLYLMISWLPSMLTAQGFDRGEVGRAVMMLTFGGAASGLVFGPLSRMKRRAALYVVCWAGMIASVAAMAFAAGDPAVAAAASFGVGFFLSGGQFLLYALATQLYPTPVRVPSSAPPRPAARLNGMSARQSGPQVGARPNAFDSFSASSACSNGLRMTRSSGVEASASASA